MKGVVAAGHHVTAEAGAQVLRDGRITRADIFLDRSEALEAVGLSE